MSSVRLLQTTSFITLISALSASSCDTALAQEQAQGGLEEITVTARKVEENLMQVPLAISAMSASDIQNAGVKDLTELSRYTPGLIDTPGMTAGRIGGPVFRTGDQLIFRGLSVATGLTFIDGAPYAGTETPDVTDVARVEVLKGPQSVYFGRSTYTGAVNYVSKEPGDKFRGYVSGDISSYGGIDTHASLEGPINDKLAFRFSGRHYSTDGQYYNPLQGDRLGAQETNSLRAFVVAKPSDVLKLSVLYTWALDEDGQPAEGVMLARKLVPTGTPGLVTSQPTGGELNCNVGGTGGPYWCGQLPNLHTLLTQDPIIVSSYDRIDSVTRTRLLDNIPLPVGQLNNAVVSYPQAFDPHWLQHFGYKQLTQNGHVKADYDTQAGWTLSSIVAWDRTKTEAISDFNFRDASELPNRAYISPAATPYLNPVDAHPAASTSITTDFSGEVRVSSPSNKRIRGTVGGSYLYISTPDVALDGYGILGSVQNNAVKNLSKTPAIFGALYFDFTQQLTLTAEARYQWDEINQAGIFPIPVPNQQNTYPSFAPRVSLDYKFADNSLAYVLYSKGYRPGGFNTALIGNVPSVVTQLQSAGAKLAYDQETLNNWEAGIKGTWLDNRLQTIIDGYYDKWINGQVNQSIFVALPSGGFASSGVTINNGSVTLSGVEGEVHYAPTVHLLIAGSAAYMHNKINSFLDAAFGPKVYGATNASGYTLPGAPKWTFSLSPQYTDHLFSDWDWFVRVDWTYRSRMFLDTHDIAWTAPLSLVNLRFGVEREKLRVEFYANNVFNNLTLPGAGVSMDVIGQNVAANGIRFVAPVKRVLGMKASYDF